MTRPAGDPIGPNEDTALGPGILTTIEHHMKVMGIQEIPRSQMLAQYAAFYAGTQHDHLRRRWDGSARDPGVNYMWERLQPQGFVPVQSVPYGLRKPNTSVSLPRQVVSRFSEMLLGHGRRPNIQTPTDKDTESYLASIFDESDSWDVLLEAREVAGACGCVAIAASIVEGTPALEVLLPFNIHVVRWKDGLGWKPQEVVEQRRVARVVPDPDTGKLETKNFIRTRLWTETHTILYDDVSEDEWEEEDVIPYKKENKIEHKAGRCPVIWYQNTHNASSPDGAPDCAGVWHLFDQVDKLASQIYTAAHKNSDPTLHVKESERLWRQINTITKGGLIKTSAEGDAKYVEMDGGAVKVGLDVYEKLRHEALQTVGCVIVDPGNAGSYKTGEALQLLWRAMEAKAARLRVTLERTAKELSQLWISWGNNLGVSNMEDESSSFGILLPPAITPKTDDSAQTSNAHIVGTARYVKLRWPAYWSPTPRQIGEMAQAMAVAQKSGTLSAETTIAEMAKTLGEDPQIELAKILAEQEAREAQEAEELALEMERIKAEQSAADEDSDDDEEEGSDDIIEDSETGV